MGSDSSKFGGVKIDLEKYIAAAGDNVKGQIHVSLKEAIEPCELFLQFKGVEITHWAEQHGKYRATYSGKSVITKVKYVLHQWTEPLAPCDFSIPFEFITPTDIPGSFQFLGNMERAAVVEYAFKAILKNSKVKLIDKQNVYLAGIERYDKINCEPVTVKLVSWCCFKNGEVSMNVRWINEFYSPEQPIECDLIVNNTRSLVDIKAVTAEIYYGINVISGSGHRGFFKENVMKSTYKVSVAKGAVLNNGNGSRFRFDLSQAPKGLDIVNIHTSTSKMMNTNFYIEFYLETGLHCLCCGDKPTYSSMFIVKPLMQFSPPIIVEAPQGWQPTVYRSVTFAYDPRDENNEKGDTQKLIEFKSLGKGADEQEIIVRGNNH